MPANFADPQERLSYWSGQVEKLRKDCKFYLEHKRQMRIEYGYNSREFANAFNVHLRMQSALAIARSNLNRWKKVTSSPSTFSTKEKE